MSTNSTWIPGEDSQTLFSERSWLQGALVSTLVYGINVCLYFVTFRQLIRSPKHVNLKKRLPLLIYITVVFILGTLFMISLSAFTQMAFIDDRNYPGGPSAFENNEFSIPLDDVGNVAFVLANWLCDGLMVWRFKVIYQTSRFPVWILVLFPCLMLLCSVGLGILFLMQVSTTSPYVANGINFTLPYLSVSLVLNILLTVLIVARLLRLRRRITSLLGPGYGRQYTSVAAIMVESVAIYSAVSLAFLILFGIGNAISQVLLQSLSQIQTVATLLIVFRIAEGKGWTSEMGNCGITTVGEMIQQIQPLPHGASDMSREPGGTKRSEDARQCLNISGDVFARGSMCVATFDA